MRRAVTRPEHARSQPAQRMQYAAAHGAPWLNKSSGALETSPVKIGPTSGYGPGSYRRVAAVARKEWFVLLLGILAYLHRRATELLIDFGV